MKKIWVLSLAFLILFCFNNRAYSYTYTINDPYTSAINSSGDRIGNIIYEIYKMDITLTGNSLKFDVYSNFPSSGHSVSGWHTMPADLGLDLNGDGNYEYGVAFRTHDSVTIGKLYSVNEWFQSGYDRPSDGFSWHHDQDVAINSIYGTALGDSPVSWNLTGGSNPTYMISTTLNTGLLTGFNNIDNFNVFYGGATCANDYIGGNVPLPPVPEPATLSLLGLGLLGLLGLKKRRSL